MYCPFCQAEDTKVLDSRLLAEGNEVRRRRKCEACQKRFTTYEKVEVSMPAVLKRDGRTEEYNLEKLRRSLDMACKKLSVKTEQIDRIVNNIEKAIMDISDKEVMSSDIGKLVMMYLRHLDPVAYVRFAAVYYREFKDVDQFLNRLKEEEQHFKIKPSKDGPVEYQA
jgi:transcriptional repressor NrdR